MDYGFYFAGFLPSPDYSQSATGSQQHDRYIHNRSRMDELMSMRITTVIQGFWDECYDTSLHVTEFHRFLGDLRLNGIKLSLRFTDIGDWYDDGGNWSTDKAETKFAYTDKNSSGVSDLDGLLASVYLSHEVIEYATHVQRVEMYQLAKSYFPNTPISVYYAGLFDRPDDPAHKDQAHTSGIGVWSDYAYGEGECDIIHLSGPDSDHSNSLVTTKKQMRMEIAYQTQLK